GSADQLIRHYKAEGFRSSKVDSQLEGRWYLDRQIGCLGASENFVNIESRSPEIGWDTGSIADKAAGFDDLLLRKERRQTGCRRHRDDAGMLTKEHRVLQNDQSASARSADRGKSTFELVRCRRLRDLKINAERLCRGLGWLEQQSVTRV